MTAVDGTIFFADVCNSTGVYDRLGDEAGRAAVARCVELMSAATERHHGTVIKTLGDEVMSIFAHAEDGLAAAADIQGTLATTPIVAGFGVAVRVGVHTGTLLREDSDYFGDTVNLAARLTSQARPGEILTTAATVEEVPAALRTQARLVDSARVKGKRAPVDLYEFVWEDENVTRIDPQRATVAVPATQVLTLRCGAREHHVGADQPSITLGRSADNDVAIDAPVVSRLHARIDYRNGHFILTDQSTNGSWVGSADQAKPVRRDSCRLTGEGSIGLGAAPGADNPHRIDFRVSTPATQARNA